MLRLELSREAEADLREILIYGTTEFGEDVADAYFNSFEAAFEMLRDYPEAGEAEEVGLGLRRWHHQNHRIFYRCDSRTVLIVRIFHHAQDLPRNIEW